MGMPISALNGVNVGLPRTVPAGSHITALLEKIRIHVYLSISNLIFSEVLYHVITTSNEVKVLHES